MTQVLAAILSGVAEGIPFFLAAAGLSLVFGVMGILNFAQGGLFMLGAFFLQSLLGGNEVPLWVFLLAVVGAGIGSAIVGGITERTLFVRTYSAGRNALIGILVSLGILLALSGLVPFIFGKQALTQKTPSIIAGRLDFFGAVVSKYSVFLVICGAVIVVGMYLLLSKTSFGKTIVAVATDRQMSSALGIRTWQVSLMVFSIAGLLAGLGGALVAPVGSIDQNIGGAYLLYAFVAMVIGGLGSVPGAFIGAMIIGIADSLFVNYLPTLQPFAVYFAAIVVLVIRPRGIFVGASSREA